MNKYTIFLKCTIHQAGLDITYYPVLTRITNTSSKRIVERAAVHRYIRDNWGSLTEVEVVRVSVEKIREVA